MEKFEPTIIQKVSKLNANKKEDLAEKFNQLDLNLVSLTQLNEYLEKAEENLTFYSKLKETDQLVGEDEKKLNENVALIKQIEEIIAGKKEESKKIMKVPEIGGKIEETAIEEEKWKNIEKQREKLKETISDWVGSFKSQLEEKYKDYKDYFEKKSEACVECANNLKKRFKNELGELFPSDNFDDEGSFAWKLYYGCTYDLERKEFGLLSFSKRSAKKEILASKELKELKDAYDEYHSAEKIKEMHLISDVFNNSENLKNDLFEIKKRSEGMLFSEDAYIIGELKKNKDMGEETGMFIKKVLEKYNAEQKDTKN